MYVCMYIYIYIYIYTHTYIHTYTRTHIAGLGHPHPVMPPVLRVELLDAVLHV